MLSWGAEKEKYVGLIWTFHHSLTKFSGIFYSLLDKMNSLGKVSTFDDLNVKKMFTWRD